MGTVYSSGVPVTQLGYKPLYETFRWSPPPPDFVPQTSDPRGKFPSGMVPSRLLSYRTYFQTLTSVSAVQNPLTDFVDSPLGGGLLSIFAQASVIGDVALGQSVSRAAVLFFEGHDVIDMPTDSLDFSDGVLTLPDRPFRVFHAGDSPLVPENDTKGASYWTSLAYNGHLEGNRLLGSLITDDAPFDVREAQASTGPAFVDTASNKVRVSGDKPKFVSYVAIDRPIFRDVVMSKFGIQASGFSNSISGFLLDATNPTSPPISYVLRFSFINVSKDPKVTKFQWRLSESMGIKPDSIEQSPSGIEAFLSQDEKVQFSVANQSNWYAYDMSDTESKDTTGHGEFFQYKPAKKAFNAMFATLKSRQGSRYFDKNFQSIVIPQKTGLGVGAGLSDPIAIGVHGLSASGVFNGGLLPEYMFTSPSLVVSSNASARLGTEYHGSLSGSKLQGIRAFWLLAKTTEAKSGLAAAYDPCLRLANLYDVLPIAAGQSAIERMIDDNKWAVNFEPRPKSDIGGMLLGEFPFRTEGKAVLLPEQQPIDSSSSDQPALPDGKFPTSIIFGAKVEQTDGPAVAKFYDNVALDGNPIIEISISPGADGTLLLGFPPVRFAAFTPGGGLANIEEIFGVTVGDVILEAMTGDKASSNHSEAQIANIGQMKWPIDISNTASAVDCVTGYYFLAFENADRVDLAIKTSYNDPFAIVRDVTLRIPDQTDAQNDTRSRRPNTGQANKKADASDLPASGLPFLVTDGPAKMAYLFYAYKGKLLCKRVIYDVLFSASVDSKTKRYSLDSEQAIISKLHGIIPSLVYDPDSGTQSSQQGQTQSQSIASDLAAGAIKVVAEPKPAQPASGGAKIQKSMDQYSACLDKFGNLFAFIQSGGQITARKSPDMGDGWSSVLEDGFSFIPLKEGETKAEAIGDLSSPFIMYDGVNDTGFLFYIASSALILQKIAMNVLRGPQAEATAKMRASLNPKILFGNVTSDMLDRSIVPSPSVVPDAAPRADSNTTVPQQRVAGYTTSDGQYRVFFKDGDGVLKSLISFDGGEEWLSDTEYEKVRANQIIPGQFFTDPNSFRTSVLG